MKEPYIPSVSDIDATDWIVDTTPRISRSFESMLDILKSTPATTAKRSAWPITKFISYANSPAPYDVRHLYLEY